MDVPQLTEDEMAEIKKDVSTRLNLDSDKQSGARVRGKKDTFHARLTPFGFLHGDRGRFIPPHLPHGHLNRTGHS